MYFAQRYLNPIGNKKFHRQGFINPFDWIQVENKETNSTPSTRESSKIEADQPKRSNRKFLSRKFKKSGSRGQGVEGGILLISIRGTFARSCSWDPAASGASGSHPRVTMATLGAQPRKPRRAHRRCVVCSSGSSQPAGLGSSTSAARHGALPCSSNAGTSSDDGSCLPCLPAPPESSRCKKNTFLICWFRPCNRHGNRLALWDGWIEQRASLLTLFQLPPGFSLKLCCCTARYLWWSIGLTGHEIFPLKASEISKFRRELAALGRELSREQLKL